MTELADPSSTRPSRARAADEAHPRSGLPAPDETTSAVFATALRCVRLGLHFLRTWAELVLLFPQLSAEQRARRVQVWCAQFLRIIRLQVQAAGATAPAGPLMVVANHVSWLDMVVLQSLRPTRFVAKSEVRTLPLIGTIATLCGTVYVERARARSTALVSARIAVALRAGDTVSLFPEGTTSDGTQVLKFHGSLLQAAIDAGAAVQPVGLSYFEAGSGHVCRRVAYAGDDTLASSIWRTLRRPTNVHLRFGAPVDSARRDRRQLASDLQSKIVSLRAQPVGARSRHRHEPT